MSPDEVPELDEETWYEECGHCPPDGFCLRCFDTGLVPHGCTEEADVAVQ